MSLAWTIYVSFIGAGLVALVPSEKAGLTRLIALTTSLVGLAVTLFAIVQGHATATLGDVVDVPWISAIGARFHLAADGISVTLLLLTSKPSDRRRAIRMRRASIWQPAAGATLSSPVAVRLTERIVAKPATAWADNQSVRGR